MLFLLLLEIILNHTDRPKLDKFIHGIYISTIWISVAAFLVTIKVVICVYNKQATVVSTDNMKHISVWLRDWRPTF